MIKVLTIVCNLGIGGTQRVAINYAIALRKQGWDSRLLAIHGGGSRLASLSEAGLPVYIINNPKEHEIINGEICGWTPDIVHVHSHGVSTDAFRATLRSLSKRPFVVETSVFSTPTPYDNEIDLTLELSDWACWLGLVRRFWKAPRRRHEVIPYSVDTATFYKESTGERKMIRDRLGIPHDARVIGRIGQPIPAKWHTGIFDVINSLARKDPKLYCVFVGLPTEFERNLKSLPGGLRARVLNLPVVKTDKELREVYNVMDVFVHWAEIGESFGVVLCEAMLCEIPVVTMATPYADNSQGEVIGDGAGGILVGTKKHMCCKIGMLLNDEGLRLGMGANGRKRVQDRYAAAVVVARIGVLYKTVHLGRAKGKVIWRNLYSILCYSFIFGFRQLSYSRKSCYYIIIAAHILLRPTFALLGLRGWYSFGKKIHDLATR